MEDLGRRLVTRSVALAVVTNESGTESIGEVGEHRNVLFVRAPDDDSTVSPVEGRRLCRVVSKKEDRRCRSIVKCICLREQARLRKGRPLLDGDW